VSEADVPMMMKLVYFGEAEKKLIRFAGEETTPTLKNDEVVVFKSFLRAGLRFPLNEMIGEVLDNFEIYLHQLTPNAIIRLSIKILVVITSRIAKIQRLRSSAIAPSGQLAGKVSGFILRPMRRKEGN
jgi:hypothetical protein